MTVKQISVFLENKAGAMQAMTGILAEHHIDMRALSLAETSEFGIVRIIVDDTKGASNVLTQEGFIHSITQVLGVAIPDEPGGLNQVLNILSGTGMNVEYMYAFLGGKETRHAYMIFHVQNPAAAVAALAAKGIDCIDQESLTAL